jgi:glycosyltransferase involved in cell wall biosynthesis
MSQVTTGDLSAIIPVGDFVKNRENITRIIQESAELGIELIIVIDNQAKSVFVDAVSLFRDLKGNGFVIKSESGNPGGSRNLGLSRATRKWVTFWDCDDAPDATQVVEMTSNHGMAECDVLIGSYEVQNLLNLQVSKHRIELNHWKIDVGLNPGIWRFVFKREFVVNLSFPDLKMGEDQVFLQRVFSKNPHVCVSQLTVYRYRINVPGQLTSEKSNLNSLILANQLALEEYRILSTKSRIIVAMLIRQFLTLSKHSSSITTSARYILSAFYLLVKNPKIFLRLFGMYATKKARIATAKI